MVQIVVVFAVKEVIVVIEFIRDAYGKSKKTIIGFPKYVTTYL